MTRRHGNLSFGALVTMGAAAAAACGGAPGGVDDPIASQPLQQGLRTNADYWPNGVVPYCWINNAPATQARRDALKNVLRASWERHANVTFDDRGDCLGVGPLDDHPQVNPTNHDNDDNVVSVAIIETPGGGGSAGLGRTQAGWLNGTSARDGGNPLPHFGVNFGEGVFTSNNLDGIVHEFGHVLSFSHEQNGNGAGDDLADCDGVGGAGYLTPWDMDSIMNYCRNNFQPNNNPGGRLSLGDIQGARAAYGPRAFGGTGANTGPELSCPRIAGIDRYVNAGNWTTGISLYCTTDPYSGSRFSTPWAGNQTGTYSYEDCPYNTVAVGVWGSANTYISRVSLICRDKDFANGTLHYTGDTSQSSTYQWTCPQGQVMTGMRTRTGAYVERIEPVCSLRPWVESFGSIDGWRIEDHVRELADVNGDGRLDVVGFGGTDVWLSLGRSDGGEGFVPPVATGITMSNAQGFHPSTSPRLVTDLNHDGRADLIAFGGTLPGTYVALSNGAGFDARVQATPEFGYDTGWRVPTMPRFLADVTGDGLLDIVVGSSRVDLQACKLEYSIVSPK